MIVFDHENIVYCDVDNTLIKHNDPGNPDAIKILNPYLNENMRVVPMKGNIMQLKRAKGRGKGIVVWSHGGAKWAESVIKALELENYVDLVLTKVEIYIDDVPIEQWQFINLFQHGDFGITATKPGLAK